MADYYPVSNATLRLLSANEKTNGEANDTAYQNAMTAPNRTYATEGNTTQVWVKNIGQTDTHLPIQLDTTSSGT